jgi:hypothetical protein
MDLCHWIQAHPELLGVILFTDEASFSRDDIRNHPDNIASAIQSLLKRAENFLVTGGHFEQLL